jgi:iron complex outermembrane receptor protein
MNRKTGWSGALLALIGLASVHAYAQVGQARAGGAKSLRAAEDVEEVIVTAQRRKESLQKIPLAVSAFGAELLEKSGVSTTDQLSVIAPGLQITQERNAAIMFIRGVGAPVSGPVADPAVAFYVDGVYYPYPAGNIFALNSVERIEVLRGPQGTLFGRNSTGGLVQVNTRTPSSEPAADLSIGYSNHDTVTASAYGTTGLTDSIAADLAAYYVDQTEGWGRNLTMGDEINKRAEYALRSKLRWAVAENWVATLAADYSHSDSDIGIYRNSVGGSVFADGRAQVGSIYDTRSNVPPDANSRQAGGSLVIAHDLALATITSTTAFRQYRTFNAFDQDSTPLPIVEAVIREKVETFQQEFLLNGEAGPFNYTAGLFYFHSIGEARPQGIRSATATLNTDLFVKQITNSYAAFAQGTYRVAEKSGLTLGLRYTSEERSIDGYRIAVPPHRLAGTILQTQALLPPGEDRSTYNKPTWRAAIDHQFTDDIMGYAYVSRGFKSGAYATNLTQRPLNPETLDAYAIGVKTMLFDHTLRLNVEGFYYDYKDMQVTLYEAGLSRALNASSGEIYGADIDVAWSPPMALGRLALSGNLSLLHAYYGTFLNAPGFIPFPGTPIPPGYTGCGPAPTTGGNRQCSVDASGHPVQRAPDFTSSLAVDYGFPIGAGYQLGFNVNWYHNGGFYWNPESRTRQSAYNIFNGQITLESPDRGWRVRVFGSNLNKEKYYSQVSVTSFGDQGAPGAPRTIGVALDWRLH